MRGTRLHPHKADSLFDECRRLERRIAERAFAIFQARGAQLGAAIDDWLKAERDTVWRPAIEVTQHDGQLVIEAAVAGVDPGVLDIQATADTLLIKAEIRHEHTAAKGVVHVCEFQPGHLFRAVTLPVAIDPERVTAEYHHGLVRIRAALAAERTRTVPVRAT